MIPRLQREGDDPVCAIVTHSARVAGSSAGAAAGDAGAVRHGGSHRIIAFALRRWNHNTLALALLHAATTPEELFRGDDWKADLAEVLVLAGWRDAREGYTVYITPEEACCLVAFMEILLGQHDLNAPHLHDLDAMGMHVPRRRRGQEDGGVRLADGERRFYDFLRQLGFRAKIPIPMLHFQPPPATHLLPAHTPAQADRRLCRAIEAFQDAAGVREDFLESVD